MLSKVGDDTSHRIGKAWEALDKKSTILKDKRILERRKKFVYESYIMLIAHFVSKTIIWTAKRLQIMEVFQSDAMKRF